MAAPAGSAFARLAAGASRTPTPWQCQGIARPMPQCARRKKGHVQLHGATDAVVGNVVSLVAPQASTELPVSRRPLTSAAVLLASASFVLTACGGGGDSPKGSGEIPGADQGKKQSASPSASSTADPNEKNRPKLKTSADFKTIFEAWSSKDRTKNDVLLDGKYQVLAVNSAIFKQDAKAPELSFYNSGPALESARGWIGKFKKAKQSQVGEIRYYNPRVELLAKNYASLIYCSDESKGFSKEIETGKKIVTPASEKSYVKYVTGMQKNSSGVWVTNSLSSKRGECKP
ncbi:hypothetical protein ACGFSD_27470 [Streptomyces caniferus]|uniref:hypothetical protein n=1 Tax=Streptomyces caniferus TaxID=285557 RepID=UPI003710F4DD